MTRIVMTGGGSGGHITPILAVARELKLLRPDCEIVYVGQTGDSLGDIPAKDPSINRTITIRAGKLRRYHGEGWRQLFDLPTLAKNLRDIGYVLIGIIQSYLLLRRLKPDVVFVKGGFVGVPVGLAAAALRVPYITHDSDAVPGLANRIIARWARLHTVALPKEVYAYPADKTLTVGVPISHQFRVRSKVELVAVRQELGLKTTDRVLLVTGGGLGAQRLNDAMQELAPQLLAAYSELVLVHIAGRKLEAEVLKRYNESLIGSDRARVRVLGFVSNLYAYSAVADIVVTRAGGNSMAEFAAQAKACIVVPNPQLAGGHQTKNAQVLQDAEAAILVSETEITRQPRALLTPIQRLLDDPQAAARLGAQLQTIARPDAARQLAMVLLETGNHAIQTNKTS